MNSSRESCSVGCALGRECDESDNLLGVALPSLLQEESDVAELGVSNPRVGVEERDWDLALPANACRASKIYASPSLNLGHGLFRQQQEPLLLPRMSTFLW